MQEERGLTPERVEAPQAVVESPCAARGRGRAFFTNSRLQGEVLGGEQVRMGPSLTWVEDGGLGASLVLASCWGRV